MLQGEAGNELGNHSRAITVKESYQSLFCSAQGEVNNSSSSMGCLELQASLFSSAHQFGARAVMGLVAL